MITTTLSCPRGKCVKRLSSHLKPDRLGYACRLYVDLSLHTFNLQIYHTSYMCVSIKYTSQ